MNQDYTGAAGVMGTSSNSRAFEIESWSYVQLKDHHLQLLQKNEPLSNREKIPATTMQRLSYYRTYASAPYKTHIICLQHTHFQRFIWSYVIHLFFKALPSTYLHLFLSSYASDEHLYLSKMVPISYGCIWLVVVSGFFELATAADLLTRYMDFIVEALTHSNPWNICPQTSTEFSTYDVKCYSIEGFREKILAGNVTQIRRSLFNSSSGELFQMAPVVYVVSRFDYLNNMMFFKTYFSIYFMLVWIIAAVSYKQLYRKFIWKFLNRIQWIKNIILLAVLLHICYVYLESERPSSLVKPLPSILVKKYGNIYNLLWETDIDFLGESNSSPPVVHLLTARCTNEQQQINPGRDSALIQASTGAYVLIEGLVAYLLRKYCEDYLRAPIQVFLINPFPWFFIWPIYFSTFKFGDLLTLVFFVLTFLLEMVAFVITYQCLLEVVVCEWPRIKRWIFTILLTVLSFVVCIVVNYKCRQLFYIYSKALCTLLEYLVIVFLYPVGRLVDDITFHYGTTPNAIRVWSIKLIPVYYSIKVYLMINGLIKLLATLGGLHVYKEYIWAYGPSLVPLVLGFFFVLGRQLIFKKQNWRTLLRPIPRWGPRDHVQRQLRKQYDSREYVGSQSSRYLSRYLVSNAEAATYKLDICYERAVRRSTIIAEQLNFM